MIYYINNILNQFNLNSIILSNIFTNKLSSLLKLRFFFIIFSLSLIIYPFNILGFNFQFIPGDLGDSRLNLYFLEHNFKYFCGYFDSYWNAPFFVPDSNVLTYSDNLIGSSPFYIFFRFFYSPIKSYQFWIVLMFILNYITSYYALKRLKFTDFSSSIGAFIFTFSIINFTHINHLQLLPKYSVPLGIFYFYNLLFNYKERYITKSVFFLVISFLNAIYIGYFLALVYLIMLVVFILFLNKQIFLKFKINSNLLLNILLSGFILVFFLSFMNNYYLRSKLMEYTEIEYIKLMQPNITDYFIPNINSKYWELLPSAFQTKYSIAEKQLFFGFSIFIVAVFSLFLIFKKSKTFYFFIISLIICFLFTIKVSFFNFYINIIEFIPGLKSIRVPSRHIVVSVFLIAIIVSFSLDFFNKIIQNKFNAYFVLFLKLTLILIIFADNSLNSNFYKFDVLKDDIRLSRIKEKIKKIPDFKNKVLILTDTLNINQNFVTQIDAMFISQSLNMKGTANGYSGYNHPNFNQLNSKLDSKKFKEWIETFTVFKPNDYVIINTF